jgi:hypothetical protein
MGKWWLREGVRALEDGIGEVEREIEEMGR